MKLSRVSRFSLRRALRFRHQIKAPMMSRATIATGTTTAIAVLAPAVRPDDFAAGWLGREEEVGRRDVVVAGWLVVGAEVEERVGVLVRVTITVFGGWESFGDSVITEVMIVVASGGSMVTDDVDGGGGGVLVGLLSDVRVGDGGWPGGVGELLGPAEVSEFMLAR